MKRYNRILLACLCVVSWTALAQVDRVNVVLALNPTGFKDKDPSFAGYVKRLRGKKVISMQIYVLNKGIEKELMILEEPSFSELRQLRIWYSCEDLDRENLSALGKLKLNQLAIFGGSDAPMLSLLPVMPTVKVFEVGLPEAFFVRNGEITTKVIAEKFPNLVTLKLPAVWLTKNEARVASLRKSIEISKVDPEVAMVVAMKALQAKSTDIIITSAKE